MIDGFLGPAFARAVARELPAPGDPRFKEGGDGLSILRAVETLGPAFARVEAFTRSEPFLAWLAELSGVPGIRRNLEASCGGLFQYADQAELDVHIDSNDVDVHCAQVGHRRKVNLLLYLTPGWREEWGGGFELYGSPSRPARRVIAPLFDRAVLFDSHDGSWHGVAPISLPPEKAGLHRMALIHNFYSTEAPGARRDPPHYNFFLPRPLPPRLRAGRKLEIPDAMEVARLLRRRDERIAGLRAIASGKPAKAAELGRDPLALLDALPAAARPGRPLTSAGLAALRRLFAARDRELLRLYRGQYAAIQRLKSRAPELVPKGY